MAVMASVRRTQEPMIISNGTSLNVVAVAILVGALALGGAVAALLGTFVPLIVAAVIGLLAMPSPKIAQQWERAIVLRFGRYVGLRGPGLFWIVPFIDRVSSVIDQRTIASGFAAEQTLTADTVPVNVDAVLFWMVHDAERRRWRCRITRVRSHGPRKRRCATSSAAPRWRSCCAGASRCRWNYRS